MPGESSLWFTTTPLYLEKWLTRFCLLHPAALHQRTVLISLEDKRRSYFPLIAIALSKSHKPPGNKEWNVEFLIGEKNALLALNGIAYTFKCYIWASLPQFTGKHSCTATLWSKVNQGFFFDRDLWLWYILIYNVNTSSLRRNLIFHGEDLTLGFHTIKRCDWF